MSQAAPIWRRLLHLVERAQEPEWFEREIKILTAQGYSDNDAVDFYSGLVGHYLLESAGLAAALGSSRETALHDLADLPVSIRTSENDQMPPFAWREQALYRRFLRQVQPLFSELATAMAALLSCYVAGEQDAALLPDDLMAEANRLADADPDGARHYVARAGALALRGQRLWWGWQSEMSPPLRRWTTHIVGLVDSITHEGHTPLAAVDVQRETWLAESDSLERLIIALEDGDVALSEVQFGQQLTPADEEVEELIYSLFRNDAREREGTQFAFQRCREAVIPYLISLAQDQSLWGVDSHGDGWAPIRAVDVLGQLAAEEAAEPLLQIISMCAPDDRLYDHALLALQNIGSKALPALLDVMRYSQDRALKVAIAPVLGVVGRGSDAAFEALYALYHQMRGDDAIVVLLGLAALQDMRCVPLLERALRRAGLTSIDRAELREALAVLQAEKSSACDRLRAS